MNHNLLVLSEISGLPTHRFSHRTILRAVNLPLPNDRATLQERLQRVWLGSVVGFVNIAEP